MTGYPNLPPRQYGDSSMPKRVLITLAIIVGIGIGTGALVFGILLMSSGGSMDEEATFVASGSAILAASIAALVSHLAGAFRELDDPDQ
jgi:hypothetical protein